MTLTQETMMMQNKLHLLYMYVGQFAIQKVNSMRVYNNMNESIMKGIKYLIYGYESKCILILFA